MSCGVEVELMLGKNWVEVELGLSRIDVELG